MARKRDNLWVQIQPKREGFDIKDFNEWYDTEHVPLRVANSLPGSSAPYTGYPGFLDALRVHATDGLEPDFGASYQISSKEMLDSEGYLKVQNFMSDREKGYFAGFTHLDRRVGIEYGETWPKKEGTEGFVATVVGGVTGDELRGVEGWTRSEWNTIYAIRGKHNKEDVKGEKEVFYEFEDESYKSTAEWKELIKRPGVKEVRTWKVLRRWANGEDGI